MMREHEAMTTMKQESSDTGNMNTDATRERGASRNQTDLAQRFIGCIPTQIATLEGPIKYYQSRSSEQTEEAPKGL